MDIKKLTDDEKEMLAKDCDVSPDILRELAQEEGHCIREAVAYNESCPLEILEKLSNDDSYRVREAVAYNKNSSLELLSKLVDDKKNTAYLEVKIAVSNAFDKRLDELEKTTFIKHYDINSFRNEPFSSAIKELNETLKKAEKEGITFEPLNSENTKQIESDKLDVGDKNSVDEIDL